MDRAPELMFVEIERKRGGRCPRVVAGVGKGQLKTAGIVARICSVLSANRAMARSVAVVKAPTTSDNSQNISYSFQCLRRATVGTDGGWQPPTCEASRPATVR